MMTILKKISAFRFSVFAFLVLWHVAVSVICQSAAVIPTGIFWTRFIFGIVFAAVCVGIAALFPQRTLNILGAEIIFAVFIWFQMCEYTCFFLLRTSFNDIFLASFNYESFACFADDYVREILLLGGSFLLALALPYLALFFSRPAPLSRKQRIFTCLITLVFGIVLSLGLDNPLKNFAVAFREFHHAFNVTAEKIPLGDWKKYGISYCPYTPDTVRATPGKNILIIHLESLDKGFLDEKMFPGLCPTINALYRSDKNLAFDHLSGNGNTFPATYHCLLGTQYFHNVNSTRGPHNDAFGNQLCSLPQILKKAGYATAYIKNANYSFTGTGDFLTHNGVDTLLCGEKVQDKKMFEMAAEEFEALAKTGRPFFLHILNFDTHCPRGRVHPDSLPYRGTPGEKYGQLLTAVHTLDAELRVFLERVKKDPAWKNTVVFIGCDHHYYHHVPEAGKKSIVEEVFGKIDTNLRRWAVILNSGRPGQRVRTLFRQYDVAPTLLELAGVKTNYVFPLGKNIFAENYQANPDFDHEKLFQYMLFKSSDELDFRKGIVVSPRPDQEWEVAVFGKKYRGKTNLLVKLNVAHKRTDKVIVFNRPLSWEWNGFPKMTKLQPDEVILVFAQSRNPIITGLGLPAKKDRYYLLYIAGDRVVSLQRLDKFSRRKAVRWKISPGETDPANFFPKYKIKEEIPWRTPDGWK